MSAISVEKIRKNKKQLLFFLVKSKSLYIAFAHCSLQKHTKIQYNFRIGCQLTDFYNGEQGMIKYHFISRLIIATTIAITLANFFFILFSPNRVKQCAFVLQFRLHTDTKRIRILLPNDMQDIKRPQKSYITIT